MSLPSAMTSERRARPATEPSAREAPVEVRLVPGMGRGVFATADIAAGEVLGLFHTIHLPAGEVRAAAGGVLSTFWFEDDADGSAYVVLGFIELLNHSARAPNLERRWIAGEAGSMVELYALRDIAAGEQLKIDYRFAGGSDDPPWACE
ncbi:MAG: SET domain-containing protein-lysine N-methyltransferase [Hyphomicrobiaceae bacterium]|nr:SET domain-containing protein-lysine N-methyltransferase [Hyphomicrobiaceae bacterium]